MPEKMNNGAKNRAKRAPKKGIRKADFAEERGVSRRAVYKAIESGRITDAVFDDGTLDRDLATKLWNENTDQRRNPEIEYKPIARPPAADRPEPKIEAEARAVGIDPDNPPSLNESRAVYEAYRAKLAELDYQERIGTVVSKVTVEKEAFALARLTRDAMLAIPDRLAAEIAGMSDPFEVHAKISHEIRLAIAEVAKGLEAAA